MDGGAPITYGECAGAVSNLVTFLRSDHGKKYDKTDLSVTTSKNGQTKIILTMRDLRLDGLHVQSHQALNVDAVFYPEVPLPKTNVQGLFAAAIKYYKDRAENTPPPALVPRTEDHTWTRGDLKLRIGFSFGPSKYFPQFTWSDMLDVTQAMAKKCVEQNAWTPIVGELHLKATATQAAYKDLGSVELFDTQLSALSVTNDDTNVAGAGNGISEVTVS